MEDHAPAERRLAFYVAKLSEAEANAAAATDHRTRQMWLDIAASWRQLANRVKKNLNLPE